MVFRFEPLALAALVELMTTPVPSHAVAAVPEPAPIVLVGAGAGVLDTLRRSGGGGGLPESVRARVKRRTSGEHVLDVFMWSVHDVGLEPYPEPRVYRQVAKWICQRVSDPTGIRLIIWMRPAIVDGRREATTSTCGEL
jgi:hypothetical protein